MGNVPCSTALTGVMADRPLELYSGKGAIGAVADIAIALPRASKHVSSRG